jgi:ferredoxin
MEEKKAVRVKDIKKEAEGRKCPLQKAIFYVDEFLAGPLCGKCFPCAFGSYEARVRLQNIIDGRGEEEDLFALQRIAEHMLVSSLCKKGKDTANFILEWMDRHAFREHIEGGCPDMDCLSFIEYRIIPEKCTMCGLCKEACEHHAILGEKREKFKSGYLPFEILQKKCVKHGNCKEVCPTGAIIVEPRKKAPVHV